MNYLHQQKGKHERAITHRPTVPTVEWASHEGKKQTETNRCEHIASEREEQRNDFIYWVRSTDHKRLIHINYVQCIPMMEYIVWKYVHLMNFTVTHGRITFECCFEIDFSCFDAQFTILLSFFLFSTCCCMKYWRCIVCNSSHSRTQIKRRFRFALAVSISIFLWQR